MFPESAKTVQNAAVRMALKRTVVLLKAYADAQTTVMEADGTVNEGGSKAYSMLTAAFSPVAGAPAAGGSSGAAPSAAASMDLGSIFRIITGAKLRDVDEEGNLVEQVTPAQAQAASSEAEERRSLRSEVACLREETKDLHTKIDRLGSMLQTLTGVSPPLPKLAPESPVEGVMGRKARLSKEGKES